MGFEKVTDVQRKRWAIEYQRAAAAHHKVGAIFMEAGFPMECGIEQRKSALQAKYARSWLFEMIGAEPEKDRVIDYAANGPAVDRPPPFDTTAVLGFQLF